MEEGTSTPHSDDEEDEKKEDSSVMAVPSETTRSRCGPKYLTELLLRIWPDWFIREHQFDHNVPCFRFLPEALIQKDLLNQGKKGGYRLDITKGVLSEPIWESSTDIVQDQFKFSHFMKQVMHGKIDLDSFPPFKKHMQQFVSESKENLTILRAAGVIEKEKRDEKEPKVSTASDGKKKTGKKKRAEGGKEKEDGEDGEKGKKGGKKKETVESGSDSEDYIEPLEMPNPEEWMKECRKITQPNVISNTPFVEILRALEFAAKNNLLKSLQFKNDEMIKFYKENDLKGSGYFETCRDKVIRKAGVRPCLVAQKAYTHGQAQLKRSMEGGSPKKKKARLTVTPSKKDNKEEKDNKRKSPRFKEKQKLSEDPVPTQKTSQRNDPSPSSAMDIDETQAADASDSDSDNVTTKV